MHRFKVRKGELWCEGVRVSQAARKFGTPLYLYSFGTLLDHYRKLKTAFSPVRPLICFSVKANGSLAILRTLVRQGAGLDVVSGGELHKALLSGCPANRIVYASVGKTAQEIQAALQAGIFCFNVESDAELEAIEQQARALRRQASVALRVNPNVAPKTHRYITTGSSENKFGIDPDAAEELALRQERFYPSTRLMGFHVHIGSQITQAKPFIQAIDRVGALMSRLRQRGLPVPWLNLGGGLGIVYKDERPQTAQSFAQAILPHLKRLGVRLILEPGRFIAGNSGILLTRVLYLKENRTKRFAIVDAGMNDLLRPSLYQAHHQILPVLQKGSRKPKKMRYDVVGPVCESGDFFAKDRALPHLAQGDLLAVMGAGAYGFTMASNYNARPKAAEVLVRGRQTYLIRERETLKDLIRHERIPNFLR